MRRTSLLSMIAVAAAATAPVAAQVPDPTRPAVQASPQDAAGVGGAPFSRGLQTVIVRPGGKSVAVIDGRNVVVGDKLGDKRVLKITEGEVILQGSGGREVLKVIHTIEKLPVKKQGATARQETKAKRP